jgi:hypothetical protein
MNSPLKWRRPRKLRGAGDLVALVAEPVAKAIDAIAKTHLSGCTGCQSRRQALNEKIPFHPRTPES